MFACETSEEKAQDPEDTAHIEQYVTDSDSDTEDHDTSDADTAEEDTAEEDCTPVVYDPNPFASSIVSYDPGEGAGFGQDSLPDIVLGPPLGAGENAGSLDVLTLGHEGEIVLAFDVEIVNGEGSDLIVYENVFIGWQETGVVSVSQDGETWYSWPCDAENPDANYPGCAGVQPSLSHPDNCIDATDPAVAGGDHFDLADIGLETASFVRVQDSGANGSGGFDLDAVAIVHGQVQ